MSGIANAINVALSGLQLFETGISTVSNNLANSTTSGYSTESIQSVSAQGLSGQPGSGVDAPIVSRASSGFAAQQLWNANTANQAAGVLASSLTNVSNSLTNSGDIQGSVNQFFNDVSTLSATPTSAAQRQTILADAQTVAGTFNSASSQIDGVITSANTSITTGINSANNLLTHLQLINQGLVQNPNNNSLLDQQQGLLNNLSTLMPINVIGQKNGAIYITTGGTILLDQSGAQALSANETGPNSTTTIAAGTTQSPVALGTTDGALGGQIATIQASEAAKQSLSALAMVFGLSVNGAQAQGLTEAGQQGGAIFSLPSPQVIAAATNTGTSTVSASVSQPSALPLDGGPFTVTYLGGAGWAAVDAASGASYPVSGTPPTFAGISISVAGNPNSGDSFSINPVAGAASAIGVSATEGSQLAAADPYVATAGSLQTDGSVKNTNAGSISTGGDAVVMTPTLGAAIVPSNYFGQALQVNFSSGTNYSVSTASNPSNIIASGSFTSGSGKLDIQYPATGGGASYWELPISGTPAAGDALALTPSGTSSGSNAQRMAGLWSANGGTISGSLQSSFISLSTQLGANAQNIQNVSTATTDQVNTATNKLQAISGVSTDQQAVLLTSYQQAYQAAAQVISTAHSMFESLIQAV